MRGALDPDTVLVMGVADVTADGAAKAGDDALRVPEGIADMTLYGVLGATKAPDTVLVMGVAGFDNELADWKSPSGFKELRDEPGRTEEKDEMGGQPACKVAGDRT